jgi:hypothetical protein
MIIVPQRITPAAVVRRLERRPDMTGADVADLMIDCVGRQLRRAKPSRRNKIRRHMIQMVNAIRRHPREIVRGVRWGYAIIYDAPARFDNIDGSWHIVYNYRDATLYVVEAHMRTFVYAVRFDIPGMPEAPLPPIKVKSIVHWDPWYDDPYNVVHGDDVVAPFGARVDVRRTRRSRSGGDDGHKAGALYFRVVNVVYGRMMWDDNVETDVE